MRTYRVKSFAKINLALNVTGKLNLLHKIESIFCFINLHDTITIKQIRSTDHRISYFGKFSKNISSNNTIANLFKILDQEKLIRNKKFQIKIDKNIPQQAGFGGGSMKPGNLVRHRGNKEIYLILKTREIKGEVVYVHLEGMPENKTHYPQSLELIT